MNPLGKDQLMDMAQEMLAKKISRACVVQTLSELTSNAEQIVAETERHPITRIILARS